MKNSIKEAINEFVGYAKINIADLAMREIDNAKKKEKLDKAMTAYIIMIMDKFSFNFIVRFFINKFVVDNIPVITQAIYDLIKDKIDGVTKE